MTISADQLEGVLLHHGDPGYEQARLDAVWNARKPDRYPGAILRARSDEDIAAAVRWAAGRGMQVSVRSGGHSWVGNGVRDGGLLIDLSQLAGIEVDAGARRVRVRPAMRGPEINRALAAHGLFFPTGHAPTVGIGGFILGGGYGWNSRTWGPACLSIRAIDVVLADGELVHADDSSHPDLLWAARGCGPGFFGVVTRFELDAYPCHQRIMRTTHTYPMELRDEVLAWTYELLADTPAAVEMSVKVGYTPTLGIQAASITSTAFCTDETGYDLLLPLEAAPFRHAALRESVNTETTLDGLYAAADALTPPGLRWALDGIWCDAPGPEVLTAAAPLLDNIPDDSSFVLWMLWGHYPQRENACWSVQAPLYLSPNAGWSDPAEDLAHERWVHEPLDAMRDLSRGLQFSDNNLADRPDMGISLENAARVEAIRARYDPGGVFRSYMTPAESTTALARSRAAR
jgi:FAD/FMN-containing dehydrogenase